MRTFVCTGAHAYASTYLPTRIPTSNYMLNIQGHTPESGRCSNRLVDRHPPSKTQRTPAPHPLNQTTSSVRSPLASTLLAPSLLTARASPQLTCEFGHHAAIMMFTTDTPFRVASHPYSLPRRRPREEATNSGSGIIGRRSPFGAPVNFPALRVELFPRFARGAPIERRANLSVTALSQSALPYARRGVLRALERSH